MVINRRNFRFPDLKKVRYLILVILLLFSSAGYILHERENTDEEIIINRSQQETEQPMEDLSADKENTPDKSEQKLNEEPTAVSVQPEYIYVDVSGAVNSPMVVCIPFGSRVFEAIDAAGGRNSESSVKYLNLASVCEDGQKIYVPTAEEIEKAESSGNTIPGQSEEDPSSTNVHNETVPDGNRSSGSASTDHKVNINTAGSEELQTLPGVGPAIASRIIDYRNTQGSFQSVEEIKSVSGIGEKIYEKLKDEICI